MHLPRERPLALALGIWLACRGALASVAIGLAGLGALVAVGYCLLARHADVTHLPAKATLVIAWSAGVMLAFGSSLRAVARDWEEGIVALARVRGVVLVIVLILAVLALAFGIVKLVALPFGGLSLDLSIFYGLALVVIAVGVLVYFGRRRQRRAQADRAEQIASRSR